SRRVSFAKTPAGGQDRPLGDLPRRPVGNAPEVHHALRETVHIVIHRLVDLVEQCMQRDESGPFAFEWRHVSETFRSRAVTLEKMDHRARPPGSGRTAASGGQSERYSCRSASIGSSRAAPAPRGPEAGHGPMRAETINL